MTEESMTNVFIMAIAMIGASAAVACDSSNATPPGNADGAADSASVTGDASHDSAALSEPLGCAAGPDAGGGYNPMIDPANFSTTIDNPYYPIVPGVVQHLKDTAGNIVEITNTTDTKVILGVTCVVVHDTVSTSAGVLSEDTYDWFAQDKAGSVWYFGEQTNVHLPDGGLDPTGSWTGGVNCAKPGIVMEANPKVGDSYRQEFYAGQAEDQADVLSVNETVTVAYGTFQNCLKTRDYTRFASGADENKYYCKGIGNLLTVDLPVSLGMREELQSLTGSGTDGGASDAGADGGPSDGGSSDAGTEGGSLEAGADAAHD
jgi:hypothetical protein